MRKSEDVVQIHLKPKVRSFNYINELSCYCGWHRLVFAKKDFLDEETHKDVHKILNEHVKLEHEFTHNPQFAVRTIKVPQQPQITP